MITVQKNHLKIAFQTFFCILAESFEAHYGEGGREGDGDVFKEANIKAFAKFVLENTDGKGNFDTFLPRGNTSLHCPRNHFIGLSFYDILM